ncbi:MAG: hypothetical protein DMG53_09035 [Acidobacteria bacterium]|nr:MAG: hypothetical protein DMG53_09035 [Acidobacteriota bacterium]
METTEFCPWCNSPITRSRFLDIETRIRAEEQKKLTAAEQSMRLKIEAQLSAQFDKQHQTSEKRLKAENEKALTKILAERDAAAKKLKAAEAREAEIHKQAKDEAAKQAAKEIEKYNLQLQKVIAERDAAAKVAEDAKLREAEIRKQAKLEADKVVQKELRTQREAIEKDRDKAILKKQAEISRERDGWQKKIKELERRIQKQTANQLGDGAEIDLYETLRETFEDDRVNRVPKGQNGADIHHHVRYKGQPCGLIVIDSKNHQGWSNSFVPKLREDQVAAGADHAILSTSAFPSGEKEMCIQSEVIIVNPARVAYVVELLRKALISMYVLGLSTKERSDTTDQLYKLITSDSYKGRFNEAVKVSEEILQLDVEEQKAHSTVWRNRGMLSKRMGNVLRGIDSDVSAIIERSSAEEGRETARPKLPPSVVSPATRRDAV